MAALERIRLHPEVQVVRDDQSGVQLVDTRSGRAFRLDAAQHFAVIRLQEAIAAEALLRMLRQRFSVTWQPQDLHSFIGTLREKGLLIQPCNDADGNTEPVGRDILKTFPLRSPVSLFHRGAVTNLFFDVLVLLFGWVLNPLMRIPVLVACALASVILIDDGARMLRQFRDFVDQFPLTLYLFFFVVPKLFLLSLITGVLTGMTCRRFGARIHTAGLRVHYGIFPMFRARQKESLLGMGKRGRLTFASVGFWSLLAIGASAVLLWKLFPRAESLQVIFLLAIPPTIIRMIVQLNPFSRTSAAYLTLCEFAGDYQMFQNSRKHRWWAFSSEESGVSQPAWRLSLYRHYRFFHLIYQVLCVFLVIAGVVLVARALTHGHVPVWSIEFAMILFAAWSSRNHRGAVQSQQHPANS